MPWKEDKERESKVIKRHVKMLADNNLGNYLIKEGKCSEYDIYKGDKTREHKEDKRAADTGNIFVEVCRITPNGEKILTCINVSTADDWDWTVHCKDGMVRTWTIPLEKFKNIAFKDRRWALKSCTDEFHTSRGLIIPYSVLHENAILLEVVEKHIFEESLLNY